MAPHRMSVRSADAVVPVRMFLLILTVVFAVESGIMLFLARVIVPESGNDVVLSLLDSVALVATLSPALWLLVVRPLRLLVAERGMLLERMLTIQEEERARLARDLHDELGQAQTAILLGVRAVSDATSLEAARLRAGSVRDMAVAAIETTRRMARGLSPAVLTDFGLEPAVARLCDDIEAAASVTVVRELDPGVDRLDPALEIAAYRIVQEALTNAVKHAGATRIGVEVRRDGDVLHVVVSDDGRGMPGGAARAAVPRQGLGLSGMRQRVLLLGGALDLTSSPAAGTTVYATCPVGKDRA